MRIIGLLALLAFTAASQSPAFAAGDDAGYYAPALSPAPASAPDAPGFALPRENSLPDTAKLLGAPREVGASEPDDDTARGAARRTKPVFATTTPPRRNGAFPNPWPAAWPSATGAPAYRKPW